MTLVIAMLLDALIGEPRWIWDRINHPAVMMGNLIGWLDNRFNTGNARRLKGAFVMLFLALLAITIGAALTITLGWIAEVLICAILLAQRSLTQHVKAVGDALRLSVGDGRKTVAMIVGRDTAQMDGPAVARSAIESAAENLSDGVTAPILWFAIGGLPGLLLYKVTNTADSMIGYLTPRHADFGWAAARLDDVLNWIPARITALIIWGFHPNAKPSVIKAEAALHRSPNAGWPESAMARGLDIALSGPRSYNGATTDDAFMNPTGRYDLGPRDIENSVALLWKTWGVILVIAIIYAIIMP